MISPSVGAMARAHEVELRADGEARHRGVAAARALRRRGHRVLLARLGQRAGRALVEVGLRLLVSTS